MSCLGAFSPAAVVGLECDWASRELAIDGRADVPLRHLSHVDPRLELQDRGWRERAQAGHHADSPTLLADELLKKIAGSLTFSWVSARGGPRSSA